MGDMGERFGVSVKVLLIGLAAWGVICLIWKEFRRLVDYLQIDLAIAVNVIFIFLLCACGLVFLMWSDHNKKTKSESKSCPYVLHVLWLRLPSRIWDDRAYWPKSLAMNGADAVFL